MNPKQVRGQQSQPIQGLQGIEKIFGRNASVKSSTLRVTNPFVVAPAVPNAITGPTDRKSVSVSSPLPQYLSDTKVPIQSNSQISHPSARVYSSLETVPPLKVHSSSPWKRVASSGGGGGGGGGEENSFISKKRSRKIYKSLDSFISLNIYWINNCAQLPRFTHTILENLPAYTNSSYVNISIHLDTSLGMVLTFLRF